MKLIWLYTISLLIVLFWKGIGLMVFPLIFLLAVAIWLVFAFRERLFKEFNKTGQYILAVSSGFYALSLMIFSLRLEKKIEVLSVPATFFICSLAVMFWLAFREENSEVKSSRMKVLKSIYTVFSFFLVVMLITVWHS